MLYKLFRAMFTYVVRGYFRKIDVQGHEHVPAKGAIVFAVNHASAFMDPIVTAVLIHRTQYFLTRGESFGNPLARFFFRRLKMIPIYRPETVPGEVYKNKEVFDFCYKHLAKGRCILVFPEGNSKTERRIRPLKSGVARIALGAEKANNFQANVVVIPVGINYSNPHRFQSDLFIKIGKPIRVADYKEQYLKNEKQASNDITEVIHAAMTDQIALINNEALDAIITNVETIYRAELVEKSVEKDEATAGFKLSREIAEAVEYFYKKDEDRVWRVNLLIQQYLYKLQRFGLKDKLLRGTQEPINLKKNALFFVLGFPVFLFGFINNALPFYLSMYLIKRIGPREDFEGSVKLAVGCFTFLGFYLGEAWLVMHYTNFWLGALYLLVLYPTGLFALQYLKKYFKVRGTLTYLVIFMKKSKLINQLLKDREAIITELEIAKKEFESTRPV